MKHCISAKCTEVIDKRGIKSWKTRVKKNVDKSVDKCPDCGNKLVYSAITKNVKKNFERFKALPY